MMKIPVGEPYLDETETESVLKVMRSGWIARGKEMDLFEENLAKYLSVKHVVLVNSGTAALEVAFRSLELKDKEIITTATSCSPTANGIIHSGNFPRFVDIDKEDHNMDPKLIEKSINDKTGAIMPVHIYGRPCKMDEILEIAKKHNLPIIEDCAQSMGARYKDKLVGSFSKISCFSLNINKIITTAEGGFVATDDDELADKSRYIRNYGRDASGSDYCYTMMGHNFKFTNLQSAIGLAQLNKIEEIIEKRRQSAAYFREALKDIKGIKIPEEKPGEFSVYFCFPILLEKEGIRDEVKKLMEEKGVECRTLFRPMSTQPYFNEMYGEHEEKFPVAENAGRNGFYVSCSPTLTKEQIDYIASSLKESLKELSG